jgi:hypothetical protein
MYRSLALPFGIRISALVAVRQDFRIFRENPLPLP